MEIRTSELEKKLLREEERKTEKRGEKYQERPQARRAISVDVAGAQTVSIQDLNQCMQKTRKHFSPCRNSKNRKEEKEDKNVLKKMAVGNVLTERE